MDLLPPLPAWDSLHPLIIHFPIALLLVAPLLIAAGLFVRNARSWAITGLVLMVLGTLATYLSVSTGQAAGELAERAAVSARAVLERHEEMAEATRTIFTALTLIFTALVMLPVVLRRPLARQVSTAATTFFLVLYIGGALFLVDTAHQGGRLVHEFGIRAPLMRGPVDPAMATQGDAAAPAEAGERGEANEAGERR